ncbi:hypothetical protein ACA910_016585 [Epithemia clementina (nom. ined.)]
MSEVWYGEGTYIDLYGCEGSFAFSGFLDASGKGNYVIEGGTDQFLGAKGYIYEEFDKNTGYSFREIFMD